MIKQNNWETVAFFKRSNGVEISYKLGIAVTYLWLKCVDRCKHRAEHAESDPEKDGTEGEHWELWMILRAENLRVVLTGC